MPIALIADIHAAAHAKFASVDEKGNNSRLQRILEALSWAGKEARKLGCTDLILVGDLFHSRKSVEVPVLHGVGEVLGQLRNSIGIHLLQGNHDTSLSGDGTHSLKQFSGMAEIYEEVSMEEIGDHKICMIPYTEDAETVNKAVDLAKSKKADLIIGHLGVIGGKCGPSDFEVPGKIPATVFPEDIPTFLGHYHKHQEVLPGLWYIGALIQHTMGEREDVPGFMIFDKGEFDFVENKVSPRFVYIDYKLAEMGKIRAIDYVKIVVPEADRAGMKLPKLEREPVVETVHEEKATVSTKFAGLSSKEVVNAWVDEMKPSEDETLIKAYKATGISLLREVGV